MQFLHILSGIPVFFVCGHSDPPCRPRKVTHPMMDTTPPFSALRGASACHAFSIQVDFDAASDLDGFTRNVSTPGSDGDALGPSFAANDGLPGVQNLHGCG